VNQWQVPLVDVRLPLAATGAASDILARGWLSMGPEVQAFEEAFAVFAGVEHAVACSSGTAALQLALAGARIQPGDEVVMPSLTFVACANIVRLMGAQPVLADITSEDDLTLDPERAAAAMTPRTRALIVMHYGGNPSATELVDLARERGIALIEDAAHAPGAGRTQVGPCGGWGLAGCFSFFANKNLPLGEGGMLTTHDPEVAALARSLRSHGMTTTTWDRAGAAHSDYDVERAGWNMRLDEPRAAMGRAVLDILEFWNGRRATAAALYRERLAGLPVAIPFTGDRRGGDSAHHLMTVLLPAGTDRDAVTHELAARGVQTSVHYRPIHRFSAYEHLGGRLERTDAVWPRLLTLPLFPHITRAQVEHVCDALSDALAQDPRTDRGAVAVPGPS
jgi:dTDP-4-amino-4,6-dideoxygalactose transaminase